MNRTIICYKCQKEVDIPFSSRRIYCKDCEKERKKTGGNNSAIIRIIASIKEDRNESARN